MSPRRQLLVRGVNWLGDAVMTTPALLRLREALPGTRITILTAAKLADLWRDHPAMDAVVTFEPEESPWTIGSRLRPLGFELALVLPNSPRAVLECWLAGIPRRVGFRRAWRNWLLTDRIPVRPEARPMHQPSKVEIAERLAGLGGNRQAIPPDAHHSLDYLHLAATLGANPQPLPPRLVVSAAEVDACRRKFGLDEGINWLGLNPGAEYGPAKRWPAERFAAVATVVAARRPVRWVLFGGTRDQPLTAAIASQVPSAVDLAGRTSLRELMSALVTCRLLLTNDTGPMHVAAALGRPVVVPFGSTSPELTGPGLPGDPRHHLIRTNAACAPCFLRECPIDFRCLLGIPVDRVVAEVLQTLSDDHHEVHEEHEGQG